MNADEFRRANAQLKSYVGPAIIVFVLYCFFWLPGFIANIIYYREAKGTEKNGRT